MNERLFVSLHSCHVFTPYLLEKSAVGFHVFNFLSLFGCRTWKVSRPNDGHVVSSSLIVLRDHERGCYSRRWPVVASSSPGILCWVRDSILAKTKAQVKNTTKENKENWQHFQTRSVKTRSDMISFFSGSRKDCRLTTNRMPSTTSFW